MSCSCPIKENVSHKLAGSVETNEFLLKNMSSWLWGKNKVLCFAHRAVQGSNCTFFLDLMQNKKRASFWHDLMLVYLTNY